MNDPRPERQFPTTRWSLIARLKSGDAQEAENAVSEIYKSYRYPLYGYLRTAGMQHEDAEDVLQSFFAKMLRQDAFIRADRDRGRLRTFLLTALSRFRSNFHRGERRRSERVQAEADLWDADEARYRMEQRPSSETPEVYYDRRWALELMQRVRQQLRLDYQERGKEDLHEALAPLLSSSQTEPESFQATAMRLGVTENALRVSLSRLRGDFRRILMREVQRTVSADEDPKEEIRHLLRLFEAS
ncbi:RNA polymerase sigma factor [Prosthecobacter sp.]|uniref:RNA polymerase sigma factor n=1 Tax=Prosthecobacter sp. TaxID=1965333 RepID=UPI00378428FF